MQLRYRLAEDTIGEDDLTALCNWLADGPWLTQGPLVRSFQERWAKWLGVRHAAFVNSGSSANFLAYHSLLLSGRMTNKKVVVPAIGWPTTITPAIQLGLEPILCDGDVLTFGLDPLFLERLCEEHRPAAVAVTHVLGVPANMDKIMALKRRYGFLLIEDACAAHGSRYGGRLVGAFGDMATFSFYFGHHASTIEGGMVVTDDEELHELSIMGREHGWAKSLPRAREAFLAGKYGVDEFNRPFAFYVPGFNLRSSDLNAFIGLRQLGKLDRVIERRLANDALYRERFRDADHFRCQYPSGDTTVSSISFAALAASREHRLKVGNVLERAGIETRSLGGGSMGRQPFWVDRYGLTPLPVADEIHERAFHLPNHPGLTGDDIGTICDTVLAVLPP